MKILIRLPNWLGDVVMSTAFVNGARQVYPEATVDVIVKNELTGIVMLMSGINNIHGFSKKEYPGLSGAYKFGKLLRAEKYDLFFNLPSSLSSITMAWATRAKKRIGYGAEGGSFLLTNSLKRPNGLHRVDEYVSLLEQFSGKKTEKKLVKLEANRPAQPIKDWVIINFNSEASSRRMPIDKAKSLLNLLTSTFKGVGFIFIGSKKEAAFVEEITRDAKNADGIQNMAGKTDLISLSHLMAAATVVLTTDSGPAHLANSLGTPTIALFGAGDETNTAPYNKQKLHVLRARKLECEPCVRNTCKLYGVPKCMQLINEMEIINALSLYLNHA